MIAGLLGIFAALKPIIGPFLAFLAGWLFPSPLQKALKGVDSVKEAQDKADHGDSSSLDRI